MIRKSVFALLTKENKMGKRYQSIDFLKGLCILTVIVIHYAWSDEERLNLLFPFWINMGVPIFMIISGFVYAKSYQRHNITIHNVFNWENVLNKLIRYTLPFLFAVLLEEILLAKIGVINIGLKQFVYTFLSGGIGPGSYYYPVMIQFIFFFPVVYFIVRKYNFKGVVICGGINLAYEIMKSAYGMNEECYRLLLFRYTLLIAFGVFLAFGKYKKSIGISLAAIVVGIVYIFLFEYFGFTPVITTYWTHTSLFAVLFIMPIAAVLLLNDKIKCKPIELLGKASYNIFLVQMLYYNVASIIYGAIENRVLQLLLNIVICVSVGFLFYLVETPITKYFIKKVYAFIDSKS